MQECVDAKINWKLAEEWEVGRGDTWKHHSLLYRKRSNLLVEKGVVVVGQHLMRSPCPPAIQPWGHLRLEPPDMLSQKWASLYVSTRSYQCCCHIPSSFQSVTLTFVTKVTIGIPLMDISSCCSSLSIISEIKTF